MAIGFGWYHPRLFRKQWIRLKGYTAETLKMEQRGMRKFYALSFVLALLTAYALWIVLALAENFYHFPRLQNGLISGFLMWLGFMMPVQASEEIYGGKKWKLFAINTGYQLVSILVMGIVLGVV